MNSQEQDMKTKPYDHQAACLKAMKDRTRFAIFMEQGLGKSKVILDEANEAFEDGRINGLLVIAPNGVHSNWALREAPKHLDMYKCFVIEYRGKWAKSKRHRNNLNAALSHKGLSIFVINVEALSTKTAAVAQAEEFLRGRQCIMVIDESSRIKNPSSRRTKTILKLGALAKYKRILTGTPVTQSPFDLYAQFRFLDPAILGFTSFHSFKHQYGKFETEYANRNGRIWKYEILESYRRLDQLQRAISLHSFRALKQDCLDLPDKIYKTYSFQMSEEQSKLYRDMSEEGVLEFDDFELLAPQQIVRLLRLQQITGGFVPIGNDDEHPGTIIPGPNPKLSFLIDSLKDDYPGKSIVWARFRFEIAMIVRTLKEEFGDDVVVELHGGVTGTDRIRAVDRFQTDDTCRFVVGQQASGIGIDLYAAENVFYYSNPFSYEQRVQSEDRCHRIGLRHPVSYVDLVIEGTIDEKVVQVLMKAGRLADETMGDKRRRKDD